MSLETGKNLGLISSIINVIVPVIFAIVYVSFFAALLGSITSLSRTTPPNFGSFFAGVGVFYGVLGAVGVVSFIGFILFVIAMYLLSRYYSEPAIFNNILYSIIIGIVGGVIIVVTYFTLIVSMIANIAQPLVPNAFLSQFLIAMVIVIALAVAISIVNAVLYMRAFNKLAEKSGVDNFKTTGLLYLIGTILSFVGIGVIIVWIGWIFATLGFSKLKPAAPATVPYPAQPPPSVMQTKRCLNCGAENLPEAIYCKSCGRPL